MLANVDMFQLCNERWQVFGEQSDSLLVVIVNNQFVGMDRGAQLEALSEGRPIRRESRVTIVKYIGYYKEILYNIFIREITSLANNLAGAN